MPCRRASILLLALVAARCGSASVRPAKYTDPEVLCPGGRSAWSLEVLDRRAHRNDEARTIAAIRDGIQASFPGCRWTAGAAPGQDTITIEVHRFASRLVEGSWEAAAEWTVSARGADGRSLTAFEANEEVSRPNYRGSDNEKESLSGAFRRSLERTAKGLQSMSANGAIRPLEGTPGNGLASSPHAVRIG